MIGARFAPNVPQAQKLLWMHQMVLLCDEAQMEACFGPFCAISVHGLHQMYNSLRNRFGCTRWYSKVTRLKWKLVSVRLEIVLILTQDR
jgi:hypothetical protein